MISFELVTTGFERVIRKAGEAGKTANRQLLISLRRRLREAVSYGRSRHLTGGTGTDRLGVRSGRLRNAFWYSVQVSESFEEAHLGFIQGPRSGTPDDPSPLVYARTHEYGATITPKRGRFLTIPTEHAKTRAGVARGKPRDFPDTFVAPGHRVPFVILQRQSRGRSQRIVPLFILVTKVTILARPTLKPTWEKFRPVILADLRQDVPQAIARGSAHG